MVPESAAQAAADLRQVQVANDACIRWRTTPAFGGERRLRSGGRLQHGCRDTIAAQSVMYWDVGIDVDECRGNPKPVQRLADTARRLGYDGIALNHTISGKVTQKCSPAYELTGATAVCTRLTVLLSDAGQVHSLTPHNNSVLSSYDLIALRPTTEKLFQQACTSIECDIISLDFTQRLPFVLKFPMVNSAIARGIMFEIGYAQLISSDGSSRQHLMSNLLNLVRITKGKNLIFSSQCSQAHLLRGPYDVINLGSLLGVNVAQGKIALSENISSAMRHGLVRRSAQGVCLAKPVSELDPIRDKWSTSAVVFL